MSNTINILFIGDIVGNPGLKLMQNHLPGLIEKYNAKCVVVNGENADNGKGINESQAEMLFGLGVHIITSGNHIWDNWHSRPLIAKEPRVLRPYNYPVGNPGMGFAYYDIDENIKVAVLNLQGRTFMQAINCPFKMAERALNLIKEKTDIILVDFHADATAEKIALGWHLDGKVSAVVGTHTHVQTADACLLPDGTAFITDVGMTGPYNSVVGLRKDIALKRFTLQTAHKYQMGSGDERICGVCIGVDVASGKAMSIEPFMQPRPPRNVIDLLEGSDE